MHGVLHLLGYDHEGEDDKAEMWARQEETLLRLFTAARRNRLEMLLEVIPSKVAPVDDDATAKIIDRIYGLGIYPDWWKLEPFKTQAAWQKAPPQRQAAQGLQQPVVWPVAPEWPSL